MSNNLTITLSDKTIEILKNFGSINQNILIKKGNVLRTMSTMKNILTYSEVDEQFPRDFGLYDVNAFLGVLKTIKNPVLDFSNDEYLVIENTGSKMKYFYTDPKFLVTPPARFNPPEIDFSFTISNNSLTDMKKISKKDCLPDVEVHTDGTNCYMTTIDVKNSTSNEYSVNVKPDDVHCIDWLQDSQRDEESDEFGLRYKVENLKVIPDDYKVGICVDAKVSQWVGPRCSYWLALEAPTIPSEQVPYRIYVPTQYMKDDDGKLTLDWKSMDDDYEQSKVDLIREREQFLKGKRETKGKH